MNDHTASVTVPVRDVADFYLRWREFRDIAVGIRQNRSLNTNEQETIEWLIRMADRIGRKDVT